MDAFTIKYCLVSTDVEVDLSEVVFFLSGRGNEFHGLNVFPDLEAGHKKKRKAGC